MTTGSENRGRLIAGQWPRAP